jgi:16S rRNA (guanine527-N7)-methyltransferase
VSNSGPDTLAERLRELGASSTLRVDADAAGRLAAYTCALLERGRDLNLTAARSPEAAFAILLVPSLGVQAAWPLGAPPSLAIDLGSGNGFPGVVVAATWPSSRVVLVERRAKKSRAIAACARAAGFSNVEALACDAREIKNEAPDLLGAADLVTLRAVGPLAETTKLAAPLLAPCGRIVHWKSAALSAAEREDGARAAAGLGLRVLDDIEQPVGDGLLLVYARPEPAA